MTVIDSLFRIVSKAETFAEKKHFQICEHFFITLYLAKLNLKPDRMIWKASTKAILIFLGSRPRLRPKVLEPVTSRRRPRTPQQLRCRCCTEDELVSDQKKIENVIKLLYKIQIENYHRNFNFPTETKKKKIHETFHLINSCQIFILFCLESKRKRTRLIRNINHDNKPIESISNI